MINDLFFFLWFEWLNVIFIFRFEVEEKKRQIYIALIELFTFRLFGIKFWFKIFKAQGYILGFEIQNKLVLDIQIQH